MYITAMYYIWGVYSNIIVILVDAFSPYRGIDISHKDFGNRAHLVYHNIIATEFAIIHKSMIRIQYKHSLFRMMLIQMVLISMVMVLTWQVEYHVAKYCSIV